MGRLRPLRGRALWTVVALVAVMVTDLVAIWSDLKEVDLMERVIDGEAVTAGELQDNDDRQALVALIQLAVFIAAVFFFIRWFHGAYTNLRELGQPNLRFRTGWAIGAWFIPFFNLWRPKQIADDIWRGSDPDAPEFTKEGWKQAPVATLVHIWWAAWVLTTLVGNFAGRLWWSGDEPDEIKEAAQADMASSVVNIVAAVIAIVVVRKMTERQEERTRRIATMPATFEPPSQSYT